MFLGILRLYLCKKNICLVNIIMSKLRFANFSFDEKSSDTLHENEKYLRFCYMNIYFFYINKISRSQGTFWYLFNFFKVVVDRARRSQTCCTAAEIRISVCARHSSELELRPGGGICNTSLVVGVTSV